jgi:hypothetical protein
MKLLNILNEIVFAILAENAILAEKTLRLLSVL